MANKKKQDAPDEMLKRLFAIAQIIVQTDRYREIQQKRAQSTTKTHRS